jgi:tetratricopeptide (TPR) repeat protein
MNFYVKHLSDYYSERGKQLPPQVIAVLEKPLAILNFEETEIYNTYIGPYQDKICAALLARYQGVGSPGDEWISQTNPYYRPVIEELVMQVLGLEAPSSLPEKIEPRISLEHRIPYQKRKSLGLKLPHISMKWAVRIAVLLMIVALLGWWYLYATAPSRLLNKAKGELEAGEYAEAIHHLEELENKYPSEEETRVARAIKEYAALEYADILSMQDMFEEAINYYDIAAARSEYAREVKEGKTAAYYGWARTLNESSNYEESYKHCESARGCAPEGYDTIPIMELRADILYKWGMQLKNQSYYDMAALRFEKCYTEWPAGPLAQSALGDYVDMTVSSRTNLLPNKTVSSSGQIEIRIHNATAYTVRYFYSGPSSLYVDISPGEMKVVNVLPGIYSRGFMVAGYDGLFVVGTDFTDTRYGWDVEVTIPMFQNSPVAVSDYDSVLNRAKELEANLPPEILDCVIDVRYERITDPVRAQDRYGDYTPDTDTVGFVLSIPSEGVDHIIFHEWGHAYSDEYLDEEEKKVYMELRGILPGTIWDIPENYSGSVEEDFADIFAVIFGNVEWINHTIYGPVINEEELRAMILLAAD